MRIAMARLVVVQAKIAAPATHVVARLNATHKVAKERELATGRQTKCRTFKITILWPALPKDRVNGARTDL